MESTSSDADELLANYYSSLCDLEINSKPMISMLTMLAKENMPISDGIVKLIENRIFEVPAEQKLNYLYLIDSICKVVGGNYLKSFPDNLIEIFCHVFEKGDEKIRSKLFKLRHTWDYLFSSKVHDIDVMVNQLDPAWPIAPEKKSTESNDINTTSKQPNRVCQLHINPNFITQGKSKINDEDLYKTKFNKKLNEMNKDQENNNLTNKRILNEPRSPSPDRKRKSPTWNSLSSKNQSTIENHLNKNQFSNHQISSFSSVPSSSIPGLTNITSSISCLSNDASSIPGLAENISATPIITNLTPSSIHSPSPVIHSKSIPSASIQQPIQSNLIHSQPQPNLNFINQNSLPLGNLNNLANMPPNVLNHHQLLGGLNNVNNLNNLPNLNSFSKLAPTSLSNLNQTKDVDYRISEFNPASENPMFSLLNNQPPKKISQSNLPDEDRQKVDDKIRRIFYLDNLAIVLMNSSIDLNLPFEELKKLNPYDLDPRLISFEGQPINVFIDEKDVIVLGFNNQWKYFYHNGIEQKIKFGSPGREIYLNNQIIQATFGGRCVPCKLIGDLNDHTLRLDTPAPKVQIGNQPCYNWWAILVAKYSNNTTTLNNGLAPSFIPPMMPGPTNVPITQQTALIMPPVINPASMIPQSIIQQPPIIQQPITQTMHSFLNQHPPAPFLPPPIVNPIVLINKDQQKPQQKSQQKSSANKGHQRHQNESITDSHITNNTINKKESKSKKKSKANKEEPVVKELVLELKPESLKIKRQSLIDSLYGGTQCSNCPRRFDNNTEKGKAKYSAHLDWHFRQNRKVRDNNFKASNLNREWYLPLELWLKYKEINKEEDANRTQNGGYDTNNKFNKDQEKQETIKLQLIKANPDDSLNICSICYEKFEQKWCDEEEEWKLENAVLNEDEKYYHPTCLSDMLNKSIEDEIAVKSEETILKISESMLENYEPSMYEDKKGDNVNGDEDKIEKDAKDKDKIDDNQENKIKKLSIKKENGENSIIENNQPNCLIENELKTEDDNFQQEDQKMQEEDSNLLVRKTVLNIVEIENEDNKTEQSETKDNEEQKDNDNIKVEIIGLEISNTLVDDELSNHSATEKATNEQTTTVKKIELMKPIKKGDSKPITLKLNVKDTELANLNNQRKNELNKETLNSPKTENSKSPVNQRSPNSNDSVFEKPEEDNLNKKKIIYRGKEESALCSIM